MAVISTAMVQLMLLSTSLLSETVGSYDTAAWGQGQFGGPGGILPGAGDRLISAFCCCRVCEQPASMEPHEWPDDITKWPVSMEGGTEPAGQLGDGICIPLCRATAPLAEGDGSLLCCHKHLSGQP